MAFTPRFAITPGVIQGGDINIYDYYQNAERYSESFYYLPFTVNTTSNVSASLSGLPADFDLYFGTIDPSTGLPTIWSDGAPITYTSSTNPGTLDENIFARLGPGDYWFRIAKNIPEALTDQQLQQVFNWKIDAKTFDASTTLSNDPGLLDQWHLFNTGILGGTQFNKDNQWIAAPNVDIRAPEAWKLANDASKIIVAIIDDGIDIGHPDLKDNIWTNPGEIAGNGIDDDNNGYTDDIHGWNFFSNTPNVVANADHSHGTHVAGIAGARGNNGIGVSGVAWNTQLMTLDVFGGGTNDATQERQIQAIRYAVKNGAKVINMSIGGARKTSPDQAIATISEAYKEALQYAYDNDVFISFAAGNDGTEFNNRSQWNNVGNLDIFAQAPSTYSRLFGNIASVASSNAQNLRSSFSNYGRSITISAPGGDGSSVAIGYQDGQPIFTTTNSTQILSTMPVGTGTVGQNYGYMNGTSMAAPVIAGMAALIRAQNSAITAPETLAILRAGADKNQRLEPYVDQGYQANLYGSLQIAQQWQGPDTLTQIGQNEAPILNLSYLTSAQKLTGTATVNRDAGYDSITGFYMVQDTQGTVFDALGNALKPGDADYAFYALSPRNIVDELSNINVANGSSREIGYQLTDAVYLAPYAITNGNTWFAWKEANADRMEHFKILGPNRIGLEDLFGGGDQDYDDVILSFASQQIL